MKLHSYHFPIILFAHYCIFTYLYKEFKIFNSNLDNVSLLTFIESKFIAEAHINKIIETQRLLNDNNGTK